MGGGKTTNVTNTGLGDDQFQTLADNQYNISDQIVGARDDADVAYDKIYDRLDGQTKNLAGLSGRIGIDGSNPTGLYKQFQKQNKDLESQFSTVAKNISNANTNINKNVNSQIKGANTNVNNQISGLSKTMGGRFDAVDKGLGTNQDLINDTFDAVGDNLDAISDVQDTANTISGDTSNIAGGLSDLSRDTADGFGDLSNDLGSGFDAATDDRQDIQDAARESRDQIRDDIGDMSRTQDTYYEDLSGTVGDIYNSQGEFQSSFDDYLDRYDDDTQLAREDRADILSGTERAFDNIREDIGDYTNAVSDYSADTDKALDKGFAGLGDSVEGGFSAIQDDMGEGFADTEETIEQEIGGLDFANTIRDLEDSVQDRIGDLDDVLAAEFETVADAFDDQGNLIENEIEANGDTITREIDAQGNLIERRFDTQGNQIDQSEINITSTLGDVESALTGNLDVFAENMGEGFADVNQGVQDEVAGMYNDLSRELADQGIDINTVLNDAFDAQNRTLDVNAASLLELGSQITGLDENMASNFKAVAGAFDAQGNLINQTVDEMGNVVTNQIDAQGNLITNKFDAQGQLIGTTETNITETLNQASEAQISLQNQLAGQLGGQMDANADAMSLGFDAQSATLSQQGQQLLTMGLNMEGLSEQQKSQMQEISGAFDAQGNLIRTGQDALGNIVEREMDANGNLITKKFDAQGNLIGETSLNVTDVMRGVNQLNSISGQIEQGFAGVQDSFGQQEGLMNEMSAQQQAQFDQTVAQIETGFDATSGVLDTQVRDIADVASQMTDLDMGMRQQFYQLGGAFDDTGQLIQESIDENGNTVRRTVDENGNLLLRAFDNTGQAIGQNVININKALGDLAAMETLPGSSISMGNLSPALEASPRGGETAVPTGGFGSPFTQTV